MDPCSSGEDFIVKTRKPYTITKQRERWTQEEHNRFLEALKLYGRAWQRIEEHIGTKTAVQIRSHAQKFFTKLEKEAVLKGVPEGHTLDIEIPPPRPKRKPSNPYPRKTSIGAQAMHSVTKDGGLSNTVSSSSSCQSKITEDLERRHEKRCDDGKLKLDDRYNNDDCSKVLGKASPPNMAPRKLFTFKEYVPPLNRTSDPQDMTMSHVTIEAGGCQANTAEKDLFKDSGSFNTSSIDNSYHSLEKSMHHDRRKDELKHSENIERFPITDVNSSLNYPRHVPVHILDGALGKSGEYITPGRGVTESVLHQAGGFHQHHNHCNPAASVYSEYDNASRSSDPNAFQSFNPVFPQIQSREDYLSFLHMSSTFSSHIVSALLQNPAAHAAASFAATLWPCVSMEAPVESPAGLESRQQTNSTPSLAAIAAATVAAAAAWWAAHGLLPLCAPFHPGLTFTPASTSLTPVESGQTRFVNNERKENSPDPALIGEKLEPECSKALQEHLSALKPPTVSSSDSERSESAKLNSGVPTAIEGEDAEAAKPVDESQVHDSSKCNNRKQVDRSSCGSNTPSSSEVDADVLEKQPKGNEENYTKDKEELKEVDLMHLTGDASGRRCRIATNLTNDSWKEVSEGGRLAFQALFRREVLPQSFSPPLDLINKVKNIKTQKGDFSAEEKGETELRWDNNYTRWIDCSQKQGVEGNVTLNGENTEEELANAKLKSRQTGFIPYKRCSAEAKDSRGSANCQDEEKGHKRIRLEGQASV